MDNKELLPPEVKQMMEYVEVKRNEWMKAREMLQAICPHGVVSNGIHMDAWDKRWDYHLGEYYQQCSYCYKVR